MPKCYLLAVTNGSSLDRYTNNVTLFSLIEQLNFPKQQPPPPGAVLPLEIHAYFELQPHELNDVAIDLSVLTTPQRVGHPSEIEVGRHGLIVEQGVRRGLLLPQVATEQGWDRDTFLSQTCVKAGLSRDAWQHGATAMRSARLTA